MVYWDCMGGRSRGHPASRAGERGEAREGKQKGEAETYWLEGALEKGKAGSKAGSQQGREWRQMKAGGTLAGTKRGKKMPRKVEGERRQLREG